MPTARCKWCNSWLFNEDIKELDASVVQWQAEKED